MSDNGIMRKFYSGATRSSEGGKPDYEGYLSPLAVEAYGEYMLSHQKQADGTMRPSDNWQKGIPLASYMKSMWRHFLQVWKLHRGYEVKSPEDGHPVTVDEALCGLMFNVQGMLDATIRGRLRLGVRFGEDNRRHARTRQAKSPEVL